MNVSDAKRLKDLELENNQLKKLLAELMLKNDSPLYKSGKRTTPS